MPELSSRTKCCLNLCRSQCARTPQVLSLFHHCTHDHQGPKHIASANWYWVDHAHLRVGGSINPGGIGAARSVAPIVSAIPADEAPAIETTSPALALSSSILLTPLRLKILVTLLSMPGAPALCIQPVSTETEWGQSGTST